MSTRATARHTRPKKLTPKQNVQIFREEQVETIIDVDTGRGQVETGVEKAEESVCDFVDLHFSYLVVACSSVVDHRSLPPHHANSPFRNTIFSKPSRHLKLPKRLRRSKMHISQHPLLLPVMSNMTCCTLKAFASLPRTSVRRPRSKTVKALRTTWTKKTKLP